MGAYIVRTIDNHEIVGVFGVRTPRDLFWYVDECVDPGLCEYATLPPGGIIWPDPDAWAVEPKDPPEDVPDIGDGVTFSGDWGRVFHEAMRWKPIPTTIEEELAAIGAAG